MTMTRGLRSRAFLGNEQSGRISSFQLEQLNFCSDAARKTGQAAACPDDTMARDDNGNRIMGDGPADRLAGHACLSQFGNTRDAPFGHGDFLLCNSG